MNGAERRRRPTIDDVADAAGVSRGTVSRVINGGRNVSPRAMAAVTKAIRRTGYVANMHARGLVTQRSQSVAFVLSEPQERLFTDPNFSVLLHGCTRALAEYDVALLLAVAGEEADRKRVIRFLSGGHVDGALLVSPHANHPVVDELRNTGLPLVACGVPHGYESELAYVAADDRGGARRMVEHLVGTGRRRVATITGPLDTYGGRHRLEGYHDVLGAVDPALIAHGDYTRVSGERAMDTLLARVPDLDAVFVGSDLMALGALTALRRAGRRVPEDVAVGGFDDSPVAVTAEPPLTTVRQPWTRIATQMSQLLLALISGEQSAAITLPTELVVRQSA